MNHSPLNISIVASEYNPEFVEGLIASARATLEGHTIHLQRVPGAFEIPLLVKRELEKEETDAVIALGLIWQGKTAHADLIATEASRALMDLMLKYDKPVLHGVLTVQDEEQAQARCLENKQNRGRECAEACLKMLLEADHG
ncbi:MAG: 6,7-dimethyl-8-ribityllumazine synthase [Verrucomicrobiota bacterium]